MGDALILETTFLVDLERESIRGEPGPAQRFLEENRAKELCITLTTAGELACGPARDERKAWEKLVGHFRLLSPDPAASWIYGQTYRYLRHNGLLIGTNDLWIASTAVSNGLPLVTRNADHFRRVPGLKVLTY